MDVHLVKNCRTTEPPPGHLNWGSPSCTWNKHESCKPTPSSLFAHTDCQPSANQHYPNTHKALGVH